MLKNDYLKILKDKSKKIDDKNWDYGKVRDMQQQRTNVIMLNNDYLLILKGKSKKLTIKTGIMVK